MQVAEVMTSEVRLVGPDQTIQDAARIMADIDAGFLPVEENDRLVGTITDRDIAIRAVAEGMEPDTKVREVMTREVKYCFADDDVAAVARNMGDIQVRRLPVMNRDKRLVGIVALGDIALVGGAEPAGAALSEISEPGGQHNQASDATAR